MRAPKITEENLRNQIDVVKEEIRLNVLNRPYGGFPWILLPPVLYQTFPNAHNGYGDFTELEQANLDDCAQFFDTYYAPANAVLTVAGDFELTRARDLIEKHFGDVPGPPGARPPVVRRAAARRASCESEHIDPHAPLPALAIGYRMPDPIAELDGYLAQPRARRRPRRGRRVPAAAAAGACASRWSPTSTPRAGCSARSRPATRTRSRSPPCTRRTSPGDRVLGAVDEELDKLAATPPSDQELAKVTARWVAGLHREHDRIISRTLALGSFELLYGDPALVYQLTDRLSAVTPDDRVGRGQGVAPRLARGADRVASRRKPVTSRSVPRPRSATPSSAPGRCPTSAPSAPPTGLSSVDTVLDNGLRVIAVHSPTVPMVELRLRIPFAGTDPRHAAIAEVLAATILTGTERRDRVAMDTDMALVGGDLGAGVDPERLSLGGNALASGFDTMLDVLADALTGAAYRDEEVSGETRPARRAHRHGPRPSPA